MVNASYPDNVGNAIVIVGMVFIWVLCAIFNVDMPWYVWIVPILFIVAAIATWGIVDSSVRNKANKMAFDEHDMRMKKYEAEIQRIAKDVLLKEKITELKDIQIKKTRYEYTKERYGENEADSEDMMEDD